MEQTKTHICMCAVCSLIPCIVLLHTYAAARLCLHVVGCWLVFASPPPADPNVGRPREPGVEDVDAAD